MKVKLFLAVAAVLVAACSAEDGDSSEDVDLAGDAPIPSMLGTFGSKIAIADNIYDDVQYDYDESDEDETTGVEAPPAPCCFPDVWQGRVWSDFGFTRLGRGRRRLSDDDTDSEDDEDKKKKKRKKHIGGGVPIVSRSLSQVYVDGANKRMAGDMMEGHSKPAEAAKSKWANISYIFQIGADKSADLYLFDRQAQKCRHRQMKNVEWTRQCIPASAKSGGQLSLGPGAGGLTVEAWMFEGSTRRADALVATPEDDSASTTIPSTTPASTTTQAPRPRPRPRPRMRLGANVLVLPGSCIPVVIQEEGLVFVGGEDKEDSNEISMKPKPKPKPKSKWRGEAFVGSAFFSDLKTTITDPKVFTVPSYCAKTPNTLYFDEMEDELPTVLERFLVL
jgi:hypothetical protein